jgi:hypothetical protein
MIIQTDFGNFGNPSDLLHYMADEGIRTVNLTADYWGARVNASLTYELVRNWADGRDFYGKKIG